MIAKPQGDTAAEIWLRYNAAENAADDRAMNALVSPTLAVTVNGHAAVASAAEDEAAMRRLRDRYPKYVREVDEVLDLHDRAVARWRMIGPAARPDEHPDLSVAGCSVITCEGGVSTEAALYYDGAALDSVIEARR